LSDSIILKFWPFIPSATSGFLTTGLSAAFYIESRIADVKSVWAAFWADPDILSLELADSLASIYFIILSVRDSFVFVYTVAYDFEAIND
jgi:hypothetical protein